MKVGGGAIVPVDYSQTAFVTPVLHAMPTMMGAHGQGCCGKKADVSIA